MKQIFLALIFVFIQLGCDQKISTIKKEPELYVCPPCGSSCDNKTFAQAGKCPHCHMELIKKSEVVNSNQGLTICFYLQDNVELLDFAGPLEVFVVAGFNVFTVSKTKDEITSQGVLRFKPDYSLQDAPPSDMMVFFGGAHGAPTNDKKVIS
jgi:hypothetical protein